MSQFSFKTAIPTASDSKGLISNNGVYFSSNTNLFKLKNNKYTLISSCDGTIEHFGIYNDYIVLCTSDRIYLNQFQNYIGSLKRSVTAIDVSNDFIAIGVGNVLEIWKMPKEYKFTLFSLHSRNIGHYRPIKFIKIINESLILTAAEDNNVRLFDISKMESKVIAILTDSPTGLFYINNTVIITCKNGNIVHINLDSMEYKNIKIDGNIVASSMYNETLAICVENMAIAPKNPDFIFSNEVKEEKKEINKNTVIILFNQLEEIFRGEIENKVLEMALECDSLYIKTADFIGNYGIHSESFEFIIDLPKILNIAIFNNMIAAGCADRKIRIYRETICTETLYDPNSKGDIINVHISENICTVVYRTGYISSFNINDSHCFRSFLITNEPLGVLSSSCISEDGCFLFVSEQANIKVINLIKSKLIETINLKSPIISMSYYRNYLYTVELDKTVSKINVFSGHSDTVVMEYLPTNLKIKAQNLIISSVKSILIYDLDLNLINSFTVQLEGRKKDEFYSKSKPVEQLDFNSNFIFCGGSSNLIKVYNENFDQKTCKLLMKNDLHQIIRVSRNKDWENYKTKLYKESDKKFNKDKVIETLNICATDNIFYLLSTDGLSIYEKDIVQLNPFEFDVKASEEYVNESINSKNYQKALISAIKLGNFDLIKKSIDSCEDKNFLIRYLPKQYSTMLFDALIRYIKQDFTKLDIHELIIKISYFHKISYPGLSDFIKNGIKATYNEVKSNKYLMDVISKRNETNN